MAGQNAKRRNRRNIVSMQTGCRRIHPAHALTELAEVLAMIGAVNDVGVVEAAERLKLCHEAHNKFVDALQGSPAVHKGAIAHVGLCVLVHGLDLAHQPVLVHLRCLVPRRHARRRGVIEEAAVLWRAHVGHMRCGRVDDCKEGIRGAR